MLGTLVAPLGRGSWVGPGAGGALAGRGRSAARFAAILSRSRVRFASCASGVRSGMTSPVMSRNAFFLALYIISNA